MYTAIIIDDELQNTKYLKEILADPALDVELVGIAHNSEGGVKLIEAKKPDIVFLDVQLNPDTGFDVLNKVKDHSFNLIFTTAYEQYALKAIKFAAIDYLLKPIDKNELRESLDKIKNRKDDSIQKSLSVFFGNIDKTKRQKLAISGASSITVVEILDIIYCEADGPYTTFYLKSSKDKIVSSKHLKEYEDLLHEHQFFRVHKSYLINLREVKQYIKSDGGRVLLSNKAELEVSDKKKEELMRLLSQEIHFLK